MSLIFANSVTYVIITIYLYLHIDRSRVDTIASQLIKCIELVIEKNHAKLSRLFKSSMKTVADELLEAGIITHDVQTNLTRPVMIFSYLVLYSFCNQRRTSRD